MGKIDFIKLNLEERLPFMDEEFDCVWCSEVLEHLLKINKTLNEFFRILRNGGILLVTVPYHGLIKNIAIALFYFNRHFDPDSQHIRFFSKKTLKKSLERSGFTIKQIKGIGRFPLLRMSLFVVAERPVRKEGLKI